MSTPALVRVVTANVQSFPVDALTSTQALEDLRRNAEIGDLVLLQEIASRYRPLVATAFPAPEWQVYYGRPDNQTPIAFRRSLFAKRAGEVTLLHPAVPGRHARRYTTYLRLRDRGTGCEMHVVNLHLVAGAWNDTPLPDKDDRVREWNEGIDGHRALVARLAATGLPVVGGGDYNRQLRRHRPLGTEIDGRLVRYAVAPGAIDLIWLLDGRGARWTVRTTRTHPGRDDENPQRHSDHGARVAEAALTVVARLPVVEPTPEEITMKQPFSRTTYGDVRPKTVDWKTRSALEEAERRLGYRLTIVQGSYNAGGVRQSAGTHDGGGVVDLLAWDWKHKVRVLRAIGFAAWYRPAVPGLWGAHIHAVLVDHGRLSASAAAQVAAYRAGRDGLKGNRVDTFWRPDPIPVFDYADARRATNGAAPTPVPGPASNGAAPDYPPRRDLDGIDTSHYQRGRLDLRAAQAAGLQWWYAKATEGTTFVDPTYAKRVRQARRAGIPVGAYHFARPDRGDASEEARFFLATADIRAGDMLPMLDLESTEGLSPAELTRWTGAWVRTVTRHLAGRGLGGKPIIYTPFDLEDGFGCFCWVARYSNDFRAPRVPRPWQRAAVWQHSNGRYGPVKHVPGVGAVDVNAVHPDVPLAALRVRPAGPTPPQQNGRPPATSAQPPADPGASDALAVRTALVTAARSIEAALARLPER